MQSPVTTQEDMRAHTPRPPERPLVQAAGSWNTIVNVYRDRVEVLKGLQSQLAEMVPHRQIVEVTLSGWVNCTLAIEDNTGRVLTLDGLALREAKEIKAAIEENKQLAAVQT
jgi:hypothetical protein